jgi:GT2 family glycosyltransferase
MKLSVVIVNYNVKYFLEQALRAAFKACAGIEAEIWVVDNNSSDGSVDWVKNHFPEVKLIANRENLGFSKANNQAMRLASGEYVLLLNPDTVVAEDCFRLCIDFMDQHPQAGGLGIRMVDGSGQFLKESKRGLPTPAVAFYKIFGLSAFFPRSKRFGRYHLGFLDEKQNHTVDILAGAFMLMRKTVLDQVGLLDEKYFMYGEDIDLSYRIRLGGFENWYFADSTIIHYKGESTKKDSVNYVRVFYQAMAIFAKQYFSPGNARLFAWLIQLGIFFRAFISILKRWSKRIFSPVMDALLIYASMYWLTDFWENNVKADEGTVYPAIFLQLIVPLFTAVWVGAAYFSGAYDKPFRPGRLIRGLLFGTMVIAAIYAFFPPELRFSRGLILAGTATAVASTLLVRLLINLALYGRGFTEKHSQKRTLIVGNGGEVDRVHAILQRAGVNSKFVGFISDEKADQQNEFYLGNQQDLLPAIQNLAVSEVIFCGENISYKQIIASFEKLRGAVEELKIVPPGTDFVIGSNHVDYPGDLYTPDFNLNINQASARRNKRVVDLAAAVGLILAYPLFFWLYPPVCRNPMQLLQLLWGRKTLVGYPNQEKLPKIKPALLDPAGNLAAGALRTRIHKAYAKDYSALEDWKVFVRALKS